MNHILLGLLCGLAFGVIDVLLMLPLKYDSKKNKTEAMTGAFIDRFLIGFIIPNLQFGISPVITGLLAGLLFSVPSSIITRAYIPINLTGLAGGGLVGLAVSFWG